MSRKTRLALAQASVLADVPKPAPDPKPDTAIYPSFPPMSLKEALLTDSKWVSLEYATRRKLAARRALEERLLLETCGDGFVY